MEPPIWAAPSGDEESVLRAARAPEIIAGLADDRYRKLEHRVKEAIEHE
ncbi:MAG: hypothetical protein NTX16_11155 [Actinobacteria bacterium]|nr:hypothetical protein [Actinomycetota bacterium]